MIREKWFHFHCPNGHTWNLKESHPRIQVACFFPRLDRCDDYAKERGIMVGGTFAHLCPECGEQGKPSNHHFWGTLGGRKCSYACLEAEGGNCKCMCGGQYHGIESR